MGRPTSVGPWQALENTHKPSMKKNAGSNGTAIVAQRCFQGRFTLLAVARTSRLCPHSGLPARRRRCTEMGNRQAASHCRLSRHFHPCRRIVFYPRCKNASSPAWDQCFPTGFMLLLGFQSNVFAESENPVIVGCTYLNAK